MRPRHHLSAVCILLLLTLALAACGGSEATEEPDPLAGCDPAAKRDLVYTRGSPGDRVVHAARANGGSDVVLNDDLELIADPVISDDGCVVAFLAEGEDTVTIWLSAADGSARRELYSAGQLRGGGIALSPDADTITAILDGGKLRRIDTVDGEDEAFELAGDYAISSVAYSPDGDSVGFVGSISGEGAPGAPDPWVVDRLGGEAEPIATTPAAERELAFSPDNRKLALAGDDGLSLLYLSGGPQRWLDLGANGSSRPSWLPDSSAVIYASGRDRPGSERTFLALPLGGQAARPILGPEPDLADPQWALQGTFP